MAPDDHCFLLKPEPYCIVRGVTVGSLSLSLSFFKSDMMVVSLFLGWAGMSRGVPSAEVLPGRAWRDGDNGECQQAAPAECLACSCSLRLPWQDSSQSGEVFKMQSSNRLNGCTTGNPGWGAVPGILLVVSITFKPLITRCSKRL